MMKYIDKIWVINNFPIPGQELLVELQELLTKASNSAWGIKSSLTSTGSSKAISLTEPSSWSELSPLE